MGIYMGSPWGTTRGKIDDVVGGVWKGITWNRVRVLPTQRGTLDLYRQLKDGLIPPERFSYPQMNIRRAVTQVLGYMARFNLSNWIYPIWEELCNKRGWIMTGSNAFVKRNASRLFNSMPEKGEEFDPATNSPDLSEMIIADGDLEGPAELLTATYDAVTGDTALTWDPSTYTNGDATDIAHVIVVKKPLMESVGRDGTWYPALYLYYIAPALAAARSDTAVTIVLPAGLDPADLTAYLFFRDAEGTIGYSVSLAMQVVASGP